MKYKLLAKHIGSTSHLVDNSKNNLTFFVFGLVTMQVDEISPCIFF
jgi:hypothetical protein